MKRLFFISLFLLAFSLYAETVYETKGEYESLKVEKNGNTYTLTTEEHYLNSELIVCIVNLDDESSAGELVYRLEGKLFNTYRSVLEQLSKETFLTKVKERKYFSDNKLIVEITYKHFVF